MPLSSNWDRETAILEIVECTSLKSAVVERGSLNQPRFEMSGITGGNIGVSGLASSPLSKRGYISGVLAAAAVFLVWAFIKEANSGNPDAGFFLVTLPIMWPLLSLSRSITGALPFFLLRKLTPQRGIDRFAFSVLLLFPIVSAFSLLIELGSRVLKPYNPYPNIIHLEPRPFVSGLMKAVAEVWPGWLLATCVGGLVCWGVDYLVLRRKQATATP
jgi:hypothetical protein